MAHFIVYLPGAKGISATNLNAVGLGDLFTGAEFMDCRGPDGGAGMLVGWRRPGGDPRFNYEPEQQQWIAAMASGELAEGRYWVGIWKDSPPLPSELKRRDFQAGDFVTLGDGQEWLMPDARELPQDFVRGEDGRIALQPREQFRPIVDEARDWVDHLVQHGKKGDNDEKIATANYFDLFDFLINALRLNYRLVPELAIEMRLLNTGNVQAPLFAVIGALAAGASR